MWGDQHPADAFVLYEHWLAGGGTLARWHAGTLARDRFATLGLVPVGGPVDHVHH